MPEDSWDPTESPNIAPAPAASPATAAQWPSGCRFRRPLGRRPIADLGEEQFPFTPENPHPPVDEFGDIGFAPTRRLGGTVRVDRR
jgi:hypothetical protein